MKLFGNVMIDCHDKNLILLKIKAESMYQKVVYLTPISDVKNVMVHKTCIVQVYYFYLTKQL